MKYLKLINILPISFFIFVLLALPAMADTHNMTGDIYNNWGVNLSKAYSEDFTKTYTDPNGWIPKGQPNVEWIVENNIDPNCEFKGYIDWTGYSATGTHLKGTGEKGSKYLEPGQPYSDGWATGHNGYYYPPAGGEPYDVEALYFDDDPAYAYIAIVTSLSPNAPVNGQVDLKPGDIGIDLDNNAGKTDKDDPSGGYEYGIKTTGNIGLIRYKPTWNFPNDFQSSTPATFDENTGQMVGGTPKNPKDIKANLIFQDVRIAEPNAIEYVDNSGTPSPNYIIEVRIPRSAIGNPPKGHITNIHITCGCGNDVIELTPVTFKTDIPEFPSIVLPVAAVMGIILILGRRNKE